mmetsp:Transcript_8980/g.15071  ORF Transcript_8980/g.15071 Transcript_8980/m.15071 type:complete len:341 (-) Transcript_8980:42-1064(-)
MFQFTAIPFLLFFGSPNRKTPLVLMRDRAVAVEVQNTLPSDFEARSAAEKEEEIMQRIMATKGERGNYSTMWGQLQFLLKDDLRPTVEHYADTVPFNREKRIHTVGYVGSICLESDGDHPFTGLFQGAPFGVIRMSSATPQDTSGMLPGVGVKFFRDGMPSANFVAMYSLDAQPEGNFFEHNFSNHVDDPNDPVQKLLAVQFRKASVPEGMVGLSDIARYNVDGTQAADGQPVYPFELILKPETSLREKFRDRSPEIDLIETFKQIPAGSLLYEMYGRPSPGAEPVFIGQMKTKSDIVDTSFGDLGLFFRHQRMGEDFEGRPDWEPAIDGNEERKCPHSG